MKSKSDTNAADEDENKWSFLRRLIVAMAAERLKKADEVVKPRPPARRDRFSLKPPFAHAASVAARSHLPSTRPVRDLAVPRRF